MVVRMVLKVLSHVRSHFVVYVALVFVSAGLSFAASDLAISGGSKVISNRVVVSPPVTPPTPGPTVLQVPGFGDLFVVRCNSDGGGARATVIFRNTSDVDIDFFADTFVDVIAPGGEVESPLLASFLITSQLGSGTGKDRKVASVTISGLFDLTTTPNECRFNAQAIVHAQKK